MLRRFAFAAPSSDFVFTDRKFGTTTADSVPMIDTTIINSMSVNPFLFCRFSTDLPIAPLFPKPYQLAGPEDAIEELFRTTSGMASA